MILLKKLMDQEILNKALKIKTSNLQKKEIIKPSTYRVFPFLLHDDPFSLCLRLRFDLCCRIV